MSLPKPQTDTDSKQHATLCNIVKATIKANNKEKIGLLCKELDCYIAYRPQSIKKWYKAMIDCSVYLSKNNNPGLWFVILKRFRWDFPVETLNIYCNFCLTLISLNKAFIKPIIESLISNLINNDNSKRCKPKHDLKNNTKMIQKLMNELKKQIPMISNIILKFIVNGFPNINKNNYTIIENYIKELINIVNILPELKSCILQLIIEKLALIDIEITKLNKKCDAGTDTDCDTNNDTDGLINSDIDNDNDHNNHTSNDNDINSNDDSDKNNMNVLHEDNDHDNKIDIDNDDDDNLMINCLDNLMYILFEYINKNANHDRNKTLIELYQIICRVFERTILLSQNTSNVAFIMFYICHFKQRFSEEFISRLFKICFDVNKPLHDRCSSVNYIGGMMCRAKYIKSNSKFNYFVILINWLVNYIKLYCKNNPFVSNISKNEANKHSLFYSVSQQVYKIYYYHANYIDNILINNTNNNVIQYIYIISNSCLKPLKYCHPIIIENFIKCLEKSNVLELSKLPSVQTSYYNTLVSKTFVNSQSFCFDCFELQKCTSFIVDLYIHEPQIDNDDDCFDKNNGKSTQVTRQVIRQVTKNGCNTCYSDQDSDIN